LLVEDDLPWLHYLFGKRYPKHYDRATTERWFRSFVVKDPLNMFAARTDDAFLVALTAVLPWIPGEPEVNVVGLCAEEDCGWQVVRLLRASIDWARKRNAARWRINTDTDYDVGALALRVGAHEISPRFEIDLRGDRQ
jgi:hypothetical protein